MTLKYIKSDLYRYTGHVSFKTFLKTYFFGMKIAAELQKAGKLKPYGENDNA